MNLYWLLPAFLIGFMGSVHCVAMCGPLAMSLPLGAGNYYQRLLGILIYNAGRIISYGVIGIICGALGKALALSGIQQWLSIAAGVFILLVFFLPTIKVQHTLLKPFYYVRSSLQQFFNKSGNKNLFIIGLLNGILPCGLVYMALAGAIASGDTLQGAGFMIAFGSGTLPAMIAVVHAGNFISETLRKKMRKTVPVFVTITALLLVLRGLNLGIPYVSPKVENNKTHACCHKN